MYTLLEDSHEIARAQQMLESTIARELKTVAIRDIGWPGGRQTQAHVCTDGTYWFWSADHKKKKNARRLNWFGRIGLGTGVAIAVEVNVPYQGANKSLAGFFARSTKNGKTYLFHSGRVGGGATGVKKDTMLAWSGVTPTMVRASDGSEREGILMMPVLGVGATRSALGYVQKIADFKDAIRAGKVLNERTRQGQKDLDNWRKEFAGRKIGRAAAREIDYESRHGEVVEALREWRLKRGIQARSKVINTRLGPVNTNCDD